ncbi:TPA: hypothetical protein MH331_25200 [Klebsiella pneumoniae]|nr:hypothetical protein [Klebsiella pneumoniae]
MLRWPAALAMSGFAQDLAPERSSTSFVLSAIMRVKQTKGSPRCDLLSWKDPGVQVRIPVSINSACAT